MDRPMENIAKALVKVQTYLTNPDKNQNGYGYKYADLASIIQQTKPILQENGLSIVQLPYDDGNGRVGVKTMLIHESGEYLQSNLTLPIPDMGKANATQSAGGAITYARRYALSAMLNISADEDTDGTSGNKKSSSNETRASFDKSTTSVPKITEDQKSKIADIAKKLDWEKQETLDWMKTTAKKDNISDITKKQGGWLIAQLIEKLGEKNTVEQVDETVTPDEIPF